jgi:predicted nucleic acid-binding protein
VIDFIIDASVCAKWFLPSEEPFHETARSLLIDFRRGVRALAVPDLFWIEFGNICWKAVRRRRWPLADAEDSLVEALQLGMQTIASRRFVPPAFAIAEKHGCSVYDGIYVALAAATDVPLITADERLARAVGGEYPVRWLGAL